MYVHMINHMDWQPLVAPVKYKPVTKLDSNCKLVQAVRYDIESQTYSASKVLVTRIAPSQRPRLFFHEALWQALVPFGFTDAQMIRNISATLFNHLVDGDMVKLKETYIGSNLQLVLTAKRHLLEYAWKALSGAEA